MEIKKFIFGLAQKIFHANIRKEFSKDRKNLPELKNFAHFALLMKLCVTQHYHFSGIFLQIIRVQKNQY